MNNRKNSTVKNLACCALLAAISIVMARPLSIPMPNGVRWSLDKFPLFLAGMFFGPLMGGLTGFVADLLGSLMQYGFTPALCPPAILYGVFGGLFSRFLAKKFSAYRLVIVYLFPVVIGSILYQSVALSFYYPHGPLKESIIYFLITRTIQFTIIMSLEAFILSVLMKANIFTRIGLWPPVQKGSQSNECQ